MNIEIGDTVFCERSMDVMGFNPDRSKPSITTFRFNGIVEDIKGDMLRLNHDGITVKKDGVVKVVKKK